MSDIYHSIISTLSSKDNAFPPGTEQWLRHLSQELLKFLPEDKVDMLTKHLPTIPTIASITHGEIAQVIVALLAIYGAWTLTKSTLSSIMPNFSIQGLMRMIPGAQSAFKKEVSQQVQGMLKPVIGYDEQLRTIPQVGITPKRLLDHCHKIQSKDVKPDGSAFAYVYETDEGEINDTVEKIFTMFSNTNALSPLAFPSLRYMENCIISSCAELLHLPQPTEKELLSSQEEVHSENNYGGAFGAVTSGGTESVICALKAHRDRAVDLWGITEPEMIAPITVHPAFTKGAHLLGIKIHLIPLVPENQYKVDMKKYKKKINSKTILLIGSAPAYPHGIIDPIEEICQLARSYKLPVHVDACIGGFFLPFVRKLQKQHPKFLTSYPLLSSPLPPWDFELPEVSSISLDLHKYAYAPKGASCIMYRNAELRKYQYFSQANWPGGLFVSPSLLGTRGGGSIAASWASLQLYGESGYMKLTLDVLKAKQVFTDAVVSIPELEIIGTPLSSIISWRVSDQYSKDLHILAIGDALELAEMKFKDGRSYKPNVKWVIERQQGPNAIHMTLMAQHIHTCDKFAEDLSNAVQYVKENMSNMLDKGSAGMYGMVVNVSKVSETLIEEFLVEFETQVMSPDTRGMCEKVHEGDNNVKVRNKNKDDEKKDDIYAKKKIARKVKDDKNEEEKEEVTKTRKARSTSRKRK